MAEGTAGICRRMSAGKAGFVSGIILSLLVSLFPFSLHAEDISRQYMDLRIAIRYRDHAQKALERGNTDEAVRILRAGMDWASSLSDIPAFLSRLEERAGASRLKVLSLQDYALRTGVFLVYSKEDLLEERAKVLFDMGRYAEALEVFDVLPPTHDRLYLQLSARLRVQPVGEISDLCRAALDQFPDSASIARLILDACVRVPFDSGLQLLVDRILSRLDYLAREDPGFLWRAALFTRDFVRRRELSSRSVQEGCREAGAILGALDTGAIGAEGAITLFFEPGRGLVERDDIDTLWHLLRSREERALFREKLSRFTGILRSSTGWGPAVPLDLRIENGRLVSLSLDRDADRVTDVVLVYADNLPVGARVFAAPGYTAVPPRKDFGLPPESVEAVMTLVWEPYPFLSSSTGAGFHTLYPAHSISLPLFPHSESPWCAGLWSLPNAADSIVLPTPAFMRANASQIEREGWAVPGSVERIRFAAGKPVAATEEIDGRVLVRRSFTNGILSREDLDLDADGRFELRRFYGLSEEGAPSQEDPAYGLRPPLQAVEADFEGNGLWVEVDTP